MMLRLMEPENAKYQTTCQYDMLNKSLFNMDNGIWDKGGHLSIQVKNT